MRRIFMMRCETISGAKLLIFQEIAIRYSVKIHYSITTTNDDSVGRYS